MGKEVLDVLSLDVNVDYGVSIGNPYYPLLGAVWIQHKRGIKCRKIKEFML